MWAGNHIWLNRSWPEGAVVLGWVSVHFLLESATDFTQLLPHLITNSRLTIFKHWCIGHVHTGDNQARKDRLEWRLPMYKNIHLIYIEDIYAGIASIRHNFQIKFYLFSDKTLFFISSTQREKEIATHSVAFAWR